MASDDPKKPPHCPFGGGSADDKQSNACLGKPLSSETLLKMENKYAAHNYHPIPMVFKRAQGCLVWDPEGRQYFDFLSAYSAVNQGHCHPRIVEAMVQQAQTCTLSSRAFYNDVFPRFAQYVTEMFGYEMVLPMNSGAEAVETALKLARKWGYMKKGIATDQAVLISCTGCFHGRTLAAVSLSSDPSCYEGFGPFLPAVEHVEYNNIDALRALLQRVGARACGFLVEPIQGEAGIVIPGEGYLAAAKRLCEEHNVLFIADEIQTGIGRTGKLLAVEHEGVRPDIVLLGKALSGGMLPVSCVLSSRDIMLCIRPGEHGSTFGGNPLASAVAIAALEVLRDEHLVERAAVLGDRMRTRLREITAELPFIKEIRGRGLLNAIEVSASWDKTAWHLCMLFKKRGLLAKPTHDTVIRLAPPLVMTDDQLEQCLAIIQRCLADIQVLDPAEYMHDVAE